MASEPYSDGNKAAAAKSVDISTVLMDFYEKDLYTDFIFRVKCDDDWLTHLVHKLVLSLWSPVFADMFYSGNMEVSLDISGVSPMAFGAMIKFFYGKVHEFDIMRKDVSFLLKMFKLATKYEVEALKIRCRKEFLLIQPNETNVFELMDASTILEGFFMNTKCTHLLQTRTTAVLASYDFSDVTPAMIQTILDLKKVSFPSEYELVNWIFAWAKNMSVNNSNRNMRCVLEPFLHSMDFVALKIEQFEDLLEIFPDVIRESEAYSIFRNILKPGVCRLPSWLSTKIERNYR